MIDLETTGLDAATSRVVECAIVQLDQDGSICSEWSSLLHVGGEEIGANAIHHISASMLATAPCFAEVAPEIVARLSGRIVVGHVVAFDLAHLNAEFARLGRSLPDLAAASLCTRDLAKEFGLDRPRTLLGCCQATGISLRGAHTALGDARSTAALLRHFLLSGSVGDLTGAARVATTVDWGVRELQPLDC